MTICVCFSIPSSTSQHLKDLLLKLLKRNPGDRINFEDFLQHPFLIAPDPNVKKPSGPRNINMTSSPVAFNNNSNLKRSTSIENSEYDEKDDDDLHSTTQKIHLQPSTNPIAKATQIKNSCEQSLDQRLKQPNMDHVKSAVQSHSLPKTSLLSNMKQFKSNNKTNEQQVYPIKRGDSTKMPTAFHQISTSPLAAQQTDQDLEDYVLVYNKNKDQPAQIEHQSVLHEELTNKAIALPVPTQVDNYKLLEKRIQKIKTPPRSIGLQTEGDRDRSCSTNSAGHAYSISPPAIKFLVGTSPTANVAQNILPRYSASFSNNEFLMKRTRQSSIPNQNQFSRQSFNQTDS